MVIRATRSSCRPWPGPVARPGMGLGTNGLAGARPDLSRDLVSGSPALTRCRNVRHGPAPTGTTR